MILDFLQYILDGLAIGSVYALVALGYSLVFGVLKLVNFAHGELYMLGAYLFMFMVSLGAPVWFAFPGAMVAVGLFSVAMERLFYKPLRGANRLAPLITAVGLSLLLQNLVQVFFTPNPQSYPVHLPDGIFEFGDDILIRQRDVIIFCLTLLLALGLDMFFRRTKTGMGIKALSMNPQAAQLVGVPMDRSVSLTFFIGATMAVVAGILQGMATNQVWPLMGVNSGLKAFAAAVFGGIGVLWGAVFGGLFLGIAESLVVGYDLSTYKDGLAFFLLIAFLLFRPQGLFGKSHLIKV